MEAENYLAGGYALRLAIESKADGWVPLRAVARCWQPSRLKGIQVGPHYGTPFLAATQVFDIRPVARKWLALERTESAEERFVETGTILVTCSGNVGRATLATEPLRAVLISHDLLRVAPKSPDQWGWIYAFLSCSSARAMMKASQYGHIIKHLETEHLGSIPIPLLRGDALQRFSEAANKVIRLRAEAFESDLKAEALFEEIIGLPRSSESGENGFIVHGASGLFSGRRRFEAFVNSPMVRKLKEHLEANSVRMMNLADAGYDVWLPGRFKRVSASEGVELLDSADLFEVNPAASKRIADGDFGDRNCGRVKAGWLLLARSGQIYGINGSVVMATTAHENKVISDDAIRIAPTRGAAPAGYVYVALSHPRLGRPLVKALAYGSSIPHIDTGDMSAVQIPRLRAEHEQRIARFAEAASVLRGQADLIEDEIARRADQFVDALLHRGESKLRGRVAES